MKTPNVQLLAYLDENSQHGIQTTAELKVLPRVREITKGLRRPNELGAIANGELEIKDSKPHENVKLLLSAENVSWLMANSEGTVPKLDPQSVTRFIPPVEEEDDDDEDVEEEEEEEVEDLGNIHTFWPGNLAEKESQTLVVVEEMEISPDYNDISRSRVLFQSLEQVLGLSSQLTSRFRALSCAGMYRYLERSLSTPGKRPGVFDLAELFREYPDPIMFENNICVGLDDRVRLAHDLSAAVFEFHKMKWLHKNISSFSILFFGEKTVAAGGIGQEDSLRKNTGDGKGRLRKVNIGMPSLIGFSHSRPGNADYSNKMHSADEALFAYRHPDYAGADAVDISSATGYLAEYDYYGLGLVLGPLYKLSMRYS
ncbi:hypothetical protein F4818DRAFT_438815 [Hypoxylon cercidicola]|nr:hypothetical protein F4818DRAFT_438815 [Hypoxylon cercidicola]